MKERVEKKVAELKSKAKKATEEKMLLDKKAAAEEKLLLEKKAAK